MVNLKTQLVKSNFKITQMKEEKGLMEYIEEELKDLDVSTLKLDPEFLKFIAEINENYNDKNIKDEKIDKLSVFKMVLKKFYKDLSPVDEKIAVGILEFLLRHKLVKNTPLTKIMLFYIKKVCGVASD